MTLPKDILIADVQAQLAEPDLSPSERKRIRRYLATLREGEDFPSDFAPAGGEWLSAAPAGS